jgi:hypothetical protein
VTMSRYIITIEADRAPPLILGSVLAGGLVTELRVEKPALMSASQLALKYSLCTETIRQRLSAIKQGSGTKCLYDPLLADEILRAPARARVGAKRKH